VNCHDYAEWIARKLEGSLPRHHLQELESHLSRCSRCRAELIFQKKILASLAEVPPSELSAGFTQRVSRRALAINRSRRRAQRRIDLIPVFAIMAAAVLFTVFRVELVRVLPPLMKRITYTIATPLARLDEAILWFSARVPGLLSGDADIFERVSMPLMPMLIATLIACIVTFWAFSRAFTFLRE
jgi:predicted anti-sigma-YlaC factor YlaD